MSGTTYSFQADIKELMNLIIHSFYSSRDIFLRELLSNSSDALEKQKHYDLSKGIIKDDYNIRVSFNKENRILIIQDNGVGMSLDDLRNNLSTIAKSGTKEFVKKFAEKKDVQIGQFGVGFYSSFLVADDVCIWSKTAECEKWNQWESDATEKYQITQLDNYENDELKTNGTIIMMSLKDDALEYLDENKLKAIVQKHSGFITFPIYLQVEKEVEKKIEEVVEEEDVVQEEAVVEEEGVVQEEETEKKVEKEVVLEWEHINGDEPIWFKETKDLEFEDYNKFYKIIKEPYGNCLHYKHFKTEGNYEFRGILFVPASVPFDFLNTQSRDFRDIKLYVKKVLVLDQLDKTMLPDWLNFVCGVIDCPDLPMNVSREMLQQSEILRVLRNQLKKQAISMIRELQHEDAKYETFYNQFYKNIKLGIHEGDEKLLEFLRFSLYGDEIPNKHSLDQYVQEKLKEGQKEIYYICNNQSPLLNSYREKGYHVIHFSDSIDEFMMQRVTKYKDYEFVNIAKEHTLPWKEEENFDKEEEFCNFLKNKLNMESVESVKMSDIYLEKDVGCIFSSKFGMTGNMQTLMKSQPLGDGKMASMMKGKQTLELNNGHPIVVQLRKYFTDDTENENIENLIHTVYQCCLLNSGYQLENPVEFSQQMIKTLSKTLV
jgi:molecular chaperone HtpG